MFVSMHNPAMRVACSGRAYSSTTRNNLAGYRQMLASSDREKFNQIVNTFLPEYQRKDMLSLNPYIQRKELVDLVDKVEKVIKIPIEYLLDNFSSSTTALHFQNNITFINLPYSEKVSKWSDRNALQSLIREKFNILFINPSPK